ncbi:MAG: SHOCT domain-containing protein [Brevundimonas sp.]
MFWTILIIIAGVIVVAVMTGVHQAKESAEKTASLDKSVREEFDIDELFVSQTDQSFVGFSFDRNMVVLGDPNFRKEYMFSEIASVDIIKNGASITSTNRGSQLLGAAVGGIALGGIGLLAGALTGSKRTMDRINELAIKITVDDRVKPLHYIQVFKWHDKKGLEVESMLVKPSIEQADRLNAHFVNGMRRAAQLLPAASTLGVIQTSSASYAEQVKQLWELHQAGAISAEEFQQQKSLLSPAVLSEAPPAAS